MKRLMINQVIVPMMRSTVQTKRLRSGTSQESKGAEAKADRNGHEIAHYLAALTLTLASVVHYDENYEEHFGTNEMESVLSAIFMIEELPNAKQRPSLAHATRRRS